MASPGPLPTRTSLQLQILYRLLSPGEWGVHIFSSSLPFSFFPIVYNITSFYLIKTQIYTDLFKFNIVDLTLSTFIIYRC
nr:hypothetical protein GZ9C4_3 [uncultured archaeon GZfos9C4]